MFHMEHVRCMRERINYTPSAEVDEAIKRFVVQVKRTSQLDISRSQALAFFVERGVASWVSAHTKQRPRKGRERKEPGGSGALPPSEQS